LLEIRFHGRGGQGAVTTAELLARAAVSEEKYAQAFPSFGPERRGAPVMAFCRVSDKKILCRYQVKEPDMVVVLDPSLLDVLDPTKGLKRDGCLVVNSELTPKQLKEKHKYNCKVACVDASKIAKEIIKLNITNTAMLGVLLKASGAVRFESLTEPFKERFGKVAENNLKACRKAFDETVMEG
jgi:2-oxoacid:acceptor oxidoreductase gamma subunit (pyruvate/2-ketoisovalerate family)